MHKSLITVPKSEDSFEKAKRTNRKKDVLIVNPANQGRVATKSIHRRIEDSKKGNPESITYKRSGILYYKAHPKAKPEILAIDGLAIWHYHKFVADVEVEGKQYRVFYNPISKDIIANEIISENCDGKEMVFLRNPADTEMSKWLEETFFKKNLPKNRRLDTIAHFRQKIVKFNKQEDLNRQSKKKPVGNQPKASLIRATLWCIKNHPKDSKYKRKILIRAYKRYGEKTHTEESFIKAVRSKWSNLIKEYSKQPEEFKKQNSIEIYAKSELKIPRNITKQKIKENKKTFN
jgi:hypothetical protein